MIRSKAKASLNSGSSQGPYIIRLITKTSGQYSARSVIFNGLRITSPIWYANLIVGFLAANEYRKLYIKQIPATNEVCNARAGTHSRVRIRF